MKIKQKLALTLIGSSLALTLGLTLAAGQFLSNLAKTDAVNASQRQLQVVEGYFSLYFQQYAELLKSRAVDPELRQAKGKLVNYLATTAPSDSEAVGDSPVPEVLARQFRLVEKNFAGIEQVEFGTVDGEYVASRFTSLPAAYDPRQQDWYTCVDLEGLGRGQTGFHLSADGEMQMAISQKVQGVDGTLAGILSCSIGMVDLGDVIDQTKIGAQGFIMVIQDDGLVIGNPRDPETVGKNIKDLADPVFRQIESMDNSTVRMNYLNTNWLAETLKSETLNWRIIAMNAEDELYAPSLIIMLQLVLLSAAFLAVMVVLSLVLAGRISRPVVQITGRLQLISQGEGDLTIELASSARDETGQMTMHFNSFLSKLRAIMSLVKTRSDELSGSYQELSANIIQNTAGVRHVLASIAGTNVSLQQQKDLIDESVKTVSMVLENIESIHKKTDESSRRVVDASSAIEEMAENIRSTADMARQGDLAAVELTGSANQGNQAISNLNQSISELGQSSTRIAEMVQLIMGISAQTNLLAMNAAIEAAHAGDSGRGFAVVADEIRKLADQSAKSARQIQDAVKTIIKSIAVNVDLAGQAGASFSQVQQNVDKVKTLSHQIAAAMEEQQVANQEILGNVSGLQGLALAIATETRQESERGNQVLGQLARLLEISQSIEDVRREETTAMNETETATLHMNDIAMQVKEVAEHLAEEVSRFKT